MKKIKPFFLAAKSKKAQHTLKVLSQKYNNYALKEANIVVVLGGDGTILSLINDEVFKNLSVTNPTGLNTSPNLKLYPLLFNLKLTTS